MQNTVQIIDRLREFNAWRRGADTEHPDPAQIGRDIDAACDLLEDYLDVAFFSMRVQSVLPYSDEMAVYWKLERSKEASRANSEIAARLLNLVERTPF